MPFWLCENRLVGLLRTISLQKQILITLCCMLAAAGCTVLFQQSTRQPSTYTNKHLKKILNTISSEKIQRLAHVDQAPLSLHAIPETIGFFAAAGFHVCTVERHLLRQRRNHRAGYVVNAHGTFENLMNFLATNKQVPATQLYLQTLSRIDDSMLEVEFFIPKRQV